MSWEQARCAHPSAAAAAAAPGHAGIANSVNKHPDTSLSRRRRAGTRIRGVQRCLSAPHASLARPPRLCVAAHARLQLPSLPAHPAPHPARGGWARRCRGVVGWLRRVLRAPPPLLPLRRTRTWCSKALAITGEAGSCTVQLPGGRGMGSPWGEQGRAGQQQWASSRSCRAAATPAAHTTSGASAGCRAAPPAAATGVAGAAPSPLIGEREGKEREEEEGFVGF